jgi:hypothetical protein
VIAGIAGIEKTVYRGFARINADQEKQLATSK